MTRCGGVADRGRGRQEAWQPGRDAGLQPDRVTIITPTPRADQPALNTGSAGLAGRPPVISNMTLIIFYTHCSFSVVDVSLV